LVSEIFDLKVPDKHTDSQTSTLSDFKGRLKLRAREPTRAIQLLQVGQWVDIYDNEFAFCLTN